jgi:hypothetical protein
MGSSVVNVIRGMRISSGGEVPIILGHRMRALMRCRLREIMELVCLLLSLYPPTGYGVNDKSH